MADNTTPEVRISEISESPGATVLSDSDVIPSDVLGSGGYISKGATIAALRSQLNFDNAFMSESDGLASTVNGQIFHVWTSINKTFVKEFFNANGISIPSLENDGVTQKVYANQKALKEAALLSDSIDNRTQGIRSRISLKYPFSVITRKGKGIIWANNKAHIFMPGGATISNLIVDLLTLAQLTVTKIVGGLESIKLISNSRYSMAFATLSGKVPFGMRADGKGTVEYQGIPLTHVRGLQPNRVATLGDSISAFAITTSGNYNSTNRDMAPLVCHQGWIIWAQLFSQGRVTFDGVYATGGFRTDEILKTHVPRVIAAAPPVCIVLGGRNNIVQGISLSKTISDFKQIFQKLRRAGILPVVCTMSAQNENTDAMKALQSGINDWLRSYAEKFSLPLIDFHAATTNPATGEWYDGYWSDKSHPNATGARVMGQCVSDTLSQWLAPTLPRKAIANTNPENDANKLDNPLFYQNDGKNPDGWTVINPGVSSVEANSAIKGMSWHLNSDSSGPATRKKTINVTAGAKMMLGYEFKADSAGTNSIYVVAGDDPAGTGYLAGMGLWKGQCDSWGYFCQEFTVPDGVTKITLFISAAGGLSLAQMSTFDISEV